MSLVVIAFLLIQDPELAPETSAPEIGFAMRSPAGWKQVNAGPPAVFRVVAPEGGAAAGATLIVYRVKSGEPILAATLAAQNVEHLKRTFAGIEVLKNEEATIAGCRGHATFSRHKENCSWQYVIGRSPTELYMVDLSYPVKEEKAGDALVQKLLASMRFFDVDESKDERDFADATARELKERKLPAAALGDSYLKILVSGKVLGTMRWSLKEAQVAGRGGYEFECETRLVGTEGDRRLESVKGSFLLDGSWQKQDGELTLEDKSLGTRTHRCVATIENGACKMTRSIKGKADDVTFKVAAGTYLDTTADFARIAVAMSGKGRYGMRIVPAFANASAPDLIEVHDPDAMKVGGEERRVRVLQSKSGAFGARTFLYEADGAPISLQASNVRIEMRRCTKEDYEKVKP